MTRLELLTLLYSIRGLLKSKEEALAMEVIEQVIAEAEKS